MEDSPGGKTPRLCRLGSLLRRRKNGAVFGARGKTDHVSIRARQALDLAFLALGTGGSSGLAGSSGGGASGCTGSVASAFLRRRPLGLVSLASWGLPSMAP